MLCIICDKKVNSSDILLLNAKGIHKNCFEEIKSNVTKYDDSINSSEIYNQKLEERTRDLSGFFNQLASIFNPTINQEISELNSKINLNKKNIELDKNKRESVLEEREKSLFEIYSFWTERPPDWDYRRKLLLSSRNYCNSCGNLNNLHIHHIRPFSDGGTHELINLMVLCETCHSNKHGGRKFKYKYENKETLYSKHFKFIQKAIESEKKVMLKYKSNRGELTVRVVFPESFERWGKSLMVHTYCELRKEKRTFNIMRIINIKSV